MWRSTILCVVLCTVAATSAAQSRALNLQAEPLSWADAAEFCRNISGHLVYPKNQQEADDLAAVMSSGNVTQVHVGLHDMLSEGVYHTVQGQLIGDTCYAVWAPGFPQGGQEYNCGGCTFDGMIDSDCESLQPFVCETNVDVIYDYLPGVGHYKYHNGLFTWNDAHRICQFENAHMLVLNSEEELQALVDFYQFTVGWVGLQHIQVDRQFLTIFDVPMEETGFSRWSAGEPSGTNEQYPYVGLTDEGYFIEGDRGYNFICERNL